ncbi:MAG: hypothetical protein Q8P90_04345 [bacterium]|nr:hypothetical protein [bacterium]
MEPVHPLAIPQEHPTDTTLIDASKLYEGGKADEGQLAAYVRTAQERGLLDKQKLDLTGGTLMTIYMAVAAEAAKPGSSVNELAFNNPGREGRVVLWSEAMAQPTVELKRSLMADQGDSKIDPTAPSQVLDLRLTFRGDPEGPEMVNAAASEAVMQQVIAQLRELRSQGDTTVRLTGFPIWLAEGAAFAAVKEGFTKVISFAPGKEVVTYDASTDQASNQMGRVESTPSQTVEASNPTASIEQVQNWRGAQTALGVELPNNEVKINAAELEALSPQAGLRLMDSVHSVAKSLTVAGIEVFQHRDPRTHDLVPKNKGQNPDLQFKDSRVPLTLNVQEALAADPMNVDAVVLALAKEAVNKASVLTITGITNAVELAIAGKVAHAAHGLIAELHYQKPDEEAVLVKSWRAKA